MSAQDGGPAFPGAPEGWNPDGTVRAYGGMSLRDYFAAKALQGIVGILHQGIRPADIDALARDCYGIADAMLAERSK